MTKSLRMLLMGILAALALFAVACGDDDEGGTGNADGGAPTEADVEPKQGGVLRQLGSSDVDYVDPGHTYYTLGYQLAYAIGRPLYNFKPGEENPVPDLAEGEPQLGEDGKSVTVKIKPNVKFSAPVNRVVTSKDVKYAFERAFSENVGGQYTFYFSSIEGAPSKPTKGVKDISGIRTPDDTTIEFKLTRPEAPVIAAALVMPITIPVPEEYAREFDAKNPSTYNTNVVATGPYMIENDAEGKLTGFKIGKSIKLVRNKNWDKATDFKPAYLDGVEWRTNGADASVDAQQVLTGSKMSLDADPPAAQLQQAVENYKGQYGSVPGGGFRWFPLNTTMEPLDDVNVRKAILAAFDRDAARKARGGKYVGDIPTHFLPPGVPGFEEAGGMEGPGVDFLANPRGDMAVAEKYMKAAGYASGKYEGDADLLMITANADPGKAQAEVAKAQFEKLGFKITLRQVPQDAVYTEYCQVPAKKVAICGSAGWFKDFNDPQSMLEPTFKGSTISKQGNNNMPQLNVPAIDAAMEKAAVLTGEERYKAWGEIDMMITEQAPAIPFTWDKATSIWSKDVQGAINPYSTQLDFAFTSLK